MDIVAIVMVLPVVLALAFGLFKLGKFFNKSQPVYTYKIIQDNTGNAVETVITNTSKTN
jgi:hypothetical protein